MSSLLLVCTAGTRCFIFNLIFALKKGFPVRESPFLGFLFVCLFAQAKGRPYGMVLKTDGKPA